MLLRVVGPRADTAIQNEPQMARSWTPARTATRSLVGLR